MSQLHKIRGCDNADRKLDVVFIHGLGGDAFETWRHGEDDSTSWPHWVGEEFPDIGVWALEYAASPWKPMRVLGWLRLRTRNSGYAMPLPDRGRQVADLIVQKGLGQRPLIFVGHSLGGLLVKQLLRCSADVGEGGQGGKIAVATRGVLFLGTPHAGAALATFGDLLKDIFGGTVALEILREHDHHLRDLSSWYVKLAARSSIETITYFETRGYKGSPVSIVNPTSANPGVGRDPVGLDEDHMTLAKPRDRDAQVCDALRELIRNGLTVSSPLPPGTTHPVPPTMPTQPPVIVHVNVMANPITSVSRTARELPPRAEHYFGRLAERERLMQRLRERRNTAVVGPGGLGKTALAAEALHTIGDETLNELFPDGSIYIDLYATRANRDAIWSRLANTVAGFSFLEQAAPRTRAEEACRGRRLLLIIEGGEEADGNDGRAELANLLSVLSAEAVRLLLTRQAKQAAPAESVVLREALAPDDAGALLDSLSRGRLVDEGRNKLLDLLAGHPLALTWAGNLLARDDEHPDRLLLDWTTAALPPLSDPTDNTHTLHWLFDRSARGLDVDTMQILAVGGLLAHAPLPIGLIEVALEGGDLPNRARAGLRALVCAGLMRIEVALPDHWQFAHVLAYRYARERPAPDEKVLTRLAGVLRERLEEVSKQVADPAAHAIAARLIDHTAALLRSSHLPTELAHQRLVNWMLFEGFNEFSQRGRTELAGYALDSVEAWFEDLPKLLANQPLWLRERSTLDDQQGRVCEAQGDVVGAMKRYEAALAVKRQLANYDQKNAVWQYDLSVSLINVGNRAAEQKRWFSALQLQREALFIRKRLSDAEPKDMQRQLDVSRCFVSLGNTLTNRGNLPAAQRLYEKALVTQRLLTKLDRENLEWKRDLQVTLTALGDVQAGRGDLRSAHRRHKAGRALAQRLADSDRSNAKLQHDLALSFGKLAETNERLKKWSSAQANAGLALQIFDHLVALDRTNATYRKHAAACRAHILRIQTKLWLEA